MLQISRGGGSKVMATSFKPGDSLWFTSFLSDCPSFVYVAVPQLNEVILTCPSSLTYPLTPLFFIPYCQSFLLASRDLFMDDPQIFTSGPDLFLSL